MNGPSEFPKRLTQAIPSETRGAIGSGAVDRSFSPRWRTIHPRRSWIPGFIAFFMAALIGRVTVVGADESGDSADDVIVRAMVDELDRSMSELHVAGLPRPYFVQYDVEDLRSWFLSAAYGGATQVNERRSRGFVSRVRVGSFTLDNTNIGRTGSMRGSLPLEDDYAAIRHAIWRLTDEDYKRAVEILARKEAYLRDRSIEDRPDDFTPGMASMLLEPRVEFSLAIGDWKDRVERLSARFRDFPEVLDSQVSVVAGATNDYVVNSEGTRLRLADSGILLQYNAEVQADDGMIFRDSRSYLAERPGELPEESVVLAELDEMCRTLQSVRVAPVVDQYTGPVLFDAEPSGRVFESLLSDGLCARPTPLGVGPGWQEWSLEKKLGLRVLPRSMSAYDDPLTKSVGGELLAGYYEYDDEGVPATRVSLIEKGILKTLVAGRTPTRKIRRSTGHARASNFDDPQARIGSLFVFDENGLSAAELKDELIQAAKEEGLDFGLRIASLQRGGPGRLGDPIYAYRVNVADGSEELIRGLQFLPVQTRSLKRILAAGTEPRVYNVLTPVPSSVVAPAILFEELELRKLEEEFDKPPILKSPATRVAKQSRGTAITLKDYASAHYFLLRDPTANWSNDAEVLADVGTEFSLFMLGQVDENRLNNQQQISLRKARERIERRIAQRIPESTRDDVLVTLARAAWSDLHCDAIEIPIKSWTFDAMSKRMWDPDVRAVMTQLRDGGIRGYEAEDDSDWGSLSDRVKSYCERLLRVDDGGTDANRRELRSKTEEH